MADKKKTKEPQMHKPAPGTQTRNTPADNAAVQKYIEKHGESPDPQTDKNWEYVEVNKDKKMGGGVGKTEWQVRPAKPKKPKAK